MKLWLFALFGEEYVQATKIVIPQKSCTRSWTWNDHDEFLSLTTTLGGHVVFAGGGNTGSTTKSHIEALRALSVLQGQSDKLIPSRLGPDDWEQLQQRFQSDNMRLLKSK